MKQQTNIEKISLPPNVSYGYVHIRFNQPRHFLLFGAPYFISVLQIYNFNYDCHCFITDIIVLESGLFAPTYYIMAMKIPSIYLTWLVKLLYLLSIWLKRMASVSRILCMH